MDTNVSMELGARFRSSKNPVRGKRETISANLGMSHLDLHGPQSPVPRRASAFLQHRLLRRQWNELCVSVTMRYNASSEFTRKGSNCGESDHLLIRPKLPRNMRFWEKRVNAS